jgi:hypothetical protein
MDTKTKPKNNMRSVLHAAPCWKAKFSKGDAMKNKKPDPTLNYNSKTPLKKADDWTRRAFLQRASLFLGAFGVPWIHQMDIFEKISKRLFGNSAAFAAGSSPIYAISLGLRSGYGGIDDHVFCMANDANAGSTHVNRSIHFDPANTLTVAPTVVGARNLYLAPQMAQFASTPYATGAAVLTAISNANGHTNMPGGQTQDGSGHFLNHLVANNAASSAPPLMNSAFVFGSADTMSVDSLGGLSVDYSPTYIRGNGEVQALFTQLKLKTANGEEFGSTLNGQVLDVLNTDFNETFLKAIESRPGGPTIASNVATLTTLLSQNLSALLTPSTNEINSILNGPGDAATGAPNGNANPLSGVAGTTNTATAPNTMQLSTVYGSSATQLANMFSTIGLLMANGVTCQAQVNIQTGDWHGNNEAWQAANNRDGSARGQHAVFWNRFLTNLFDSYSTRDAYIVPGTGGKKLGEVLRMVWYSEFTRTPMIGSNATDYGDGGKKGIVLIDPGKSSNLVPGTYGNVNSSARSVKPNTTTGNDDVQGQLEVAYMFNTIAKFLGLDLTEAAVASSNRSKFIQAMFS